MARDINECLMSVQELSDLHAQHLFDTHAQAIVRLMDPADYHAYRVAVLISTLCDADLATCTKHMARDINECLMSVQELSDLHAQHLFDTHAQAIVRLMDPADYHAYRVAVELAPAEEEVCRIIRSAPGNMGSTGDSVTKPEQAVSA